MLEDLIMDKKSNRSAQQSRAPAVDCKKSSDLTLRPWPRHNKKREGSGSVPKNEPYRKNGPAQRGRGQVDRRPRARGSTGDAVGGMEVTGIAEEEPELGSVFVPGSKKQNLNHLLNFMYTPRGTQERRGQVSRRPVTHQYRAAHPHNRDLYLQACCQFVVKEEGDYKANLLDPDVPVNWEQIEEIVVRSSGKSECPICLGSPVAGRVGHCGHVHCWACALHYSTSHERSPPPCPVCAAPFHVANMKPARMQQWEPPGEEVSMRLVRRLRGSSVVEIAPARGDPADSCDVIQPVANINEAPYSKMFLASKAQVRDILERERKELQDQIYAEIDTTEITYLEQALEMLKQKETNLNGQLDMPKAVENTTEGTAPTVYEKQVTNDKKMDWFDVNEDGATCVEVIQTQMEDMTINLDHSNLNPEAVEFEHNNVNDNQAVEFPLIDDGQPKDEHTDYGFELLTDVDKENQAKYFYFYQAEDGQQVFLNSLNVRVLNASWGALCAAPLRIRGRVLHRETLSLVEQTRKHMPYAAHLPLYCPFDIVELDLQPPVVTAHAVNSFAAELDRRARIRARNDREERRRERAYRRTVEGPPRPDFSSQVMFPPTSPPAYSPPAFVESPPHVAAAPSASPSGLSFAKMASTSGTWRVRNKEVVREPSPSAAAAAADDEEGSAPRLLCLSDAIEAALNSAPLPAAAPASGKKKKNKPKVLFATGMQRAA